MTTSLASSFSSLESLQANRMGKLLTLHLEKAESVIWPSLIVGPIPSFISPPIPGLPGASDVSQEEKYNMDATSLSVIGVDLLDVKKDKEEAFEFIV